MTEQFTTPSQLTTDKVSPDSKKQQSGIRPLLVRISLVLLFIFFADFWVDMLLSGTDLFLDSVSTLFDLLLQFQGYLALELVAKQFELSIRSAELATFYGLLPFQLVLIGYVILRFIRWLKRFPKALKRRWLNEKDLIKRSWQQLEWYWKIGIVSALLASSQLLL